MKRAKLISSAVAALTLLGAGVPVVAMASAPIQLDGSSITVSYADLNIANAPGARVLYSRLERASREVCDVQSLTEAGSVRRVTQAQECYNAALSDAVAKIGSDELSKIHSG